MKRIVTIMVVILSLVMNVNAQTGKWSSSVNGSDELLSDGENYTSYVYCESNASIVIWSNDDKKFRIASNSHIFDYNGKGATGYGVFDAIIGLYDENNKLIQKIDKFLFEIDDVDESKRAHPNKYTRMGGNNLKKSAQIINYIKNNKGYVRIVAELYGGTRFDLKVPCFNN